jgi:hypothetical protein
MSVCESGRRKGSGRTGKKIGKRRMMMREKMGEMMGGEQSTMRNPALPLHLPLPLRR